MGLTRAAVRVENPCSHRTLDATCLVDSGSVFFTVTPAMALALGFDTTEVSQREVVLADGGRVSVPMIGPLRVCFQDRHCDLSALVLGDEPLLGVVPMEMMDLVILPATQTLAVNPASPDIAQVPAKPAAVASPRLQAAARCSA